MSKIYEIGRIYCLRSYQTDDIYIGSTFNPLHKRFYKHKGHYKLWKEGKKNYITSCELIKYDDCYIELIEEHYNLNKNQLEKIEGEHIRKNKCVNKLIPCRTRKEYRLENRPDILKKKKEYYEKNKSQINKKIECECGGNYIHNHKARHLKTKLHLKYIEDKKEKIFV
jgi:hypothetical protein